MEQFDLSSGSFTLPGEDGYEELTLRLAARWGADCIRDSDGTSLSQAILNSPFTIYSTLCLVRADNAWALANPSKAQQNYLMSQAVLSNGGDIAIDLLSGYSRDQFSVNLTDDPAQWWQVFDRTSGQEVSPNLWSVSSNGEVHIRKTEQGHVYTVNFLVYRLWEEISMYNHITNGWGDKERLMAVDPRYPETQAHVLAYLETWLKNHPATGIVRFTSLFYNFAWFWGDKSALRFRYSDWGSYDFAVSPRALVEFEKRYGYKLRSEDFVNAGRYNATHNPPSARYRAWMDFVNAFVVGFGRSCVDLVHRYGKKAYLFYDDHWIGTEPYGDRFGDFAFDGIIKCVFNGFEARVCAGVKHFAVKELRLHPYLFPTGLRGEATFQEGGNPTADAKLFWSRIRRALLRAPIDRIGLGGYLHLVEGFPDFQAYIAELAKEFRLIKSLHSLGQPYVLPFKVGILTSWGKIRSWTCSGHLHEHPDLELIQVLESLSGLPFDVEFLCFDELLKGSIDPDIKVLINAGRGGDAWSGGAVWRDPRLVSLISAFVAAGGGLIGIGEPSAVDKAPFYFQLAPLFGLDKELGFTRCSNKFVFNLVREHFIMKDMEGEPDFGVDVKGLFVLDEATEVLCGSALSPRIATRRIGSGRTVYFSGFVHTLENARLLYRALCWAAGAEKRFSEWSCEDYRLDCAYYPKSEQIAVINNTDQSLVSHLSQANGLSRQVDLPPYGLLVLGRENKVSS